MFADIVIPDGNEKEFIEIAKKLDYTSLIFAYPYKAKVPKIEDSKIKIHIARIITKKELNRVNSIKEIVIAKAEQENRAFFESKGVDIIYNLEKISKKDFIHHKASGMNQVLGKLAKQNKISVAFSFAMILNSKGNLRSTIMARISQNIRFCRKYKINMITASFAENPFHMRYPRDLMVFMQDQGMEGGEAKKSLQIRKV